MTKEESGASFHSCRHITTLQFRLTVMTVLVVLAILSGSTVPDHRLQFKRHLEASPASLEEQARALRAARLRIHKRDEFARYVDDFCAQMNEHISPGHLS